VRHDLVVETEKLVRSWAQHQPAWLRDYLVAGVEDPRLNAQSILSRHFLVRALVDEPLDQLMLEEHRFAAAVRWLAGKRDLLEDRESRAATLDALQRGADNAEGIEIPAFIARTFNNLPVLGPGFRVPNYLDEFLAERAQGGDALATLLGTFAQIWSLILPGARKRSSGKGQDRRFSIVPASPGGNARASLLEPACGSANDYRFFDLYGIAPMLDYTGFDLCPANVENARALFPQAHFEAGNVFEIAATDKSFDLCVVHDLFEHLSLIGLEQAVQEVCRVTRRALCVGFFQMDEIAGHIVRPRDEYYWNLLSMDQTKRLFARYGFVAQAIHIDSFLSRQTGAPPAHNPQAFTFVLQAR
jgi:SAM-dependent methyltransferase